MNRTLLTQNGYQKLTIELNDLKIKQEHLITQIEDVAQPDESGEDGLVSQLKEELEVVNDKIGNIEDTLSSSEIINGELTKKNIIQVGSTVKIKISGNSTKKFYIVNHMESDPSLNKISDQSPLGQALIGKKVNDEFEVSAPIGKITYKIVAIT